MGSKLLNALDQDSFAVSFMDLKLERERFTLRREKVRWGLDWRIIKIMCFFQGGYALRGITSGITKVNLDAQEQWEGLP